VKELRDEAKFNPFLRDVGNPPKGISEYAFLMGKLGSPKERAKRIKKYVDRAKDKEGRIQINWTHLLLAALVEKGYINRILTTNFDPLIVDALAIMGQPIRTFDLNITGKYFPGTLDPATIVYLHGQMHSLFLANTPDEMDRVQNLYPSVLQEAVQDSLLIVVGYSGDCDPVLKSLMVSRIFLVDYGGHITAAVEGK
jgi:NAD-dependent SIR2 family protein deacetylase